MSTLPSVTSSPPPPASSPPPPLSPSLDAATPNASTSQNPSADEPIEAERRLQELFEDPLLSDLPPNLTIQEVDTLIALELGTAFEITIERNGLEDIGEIILS